jgi:glyoxylase-like metal-dependent hydrolase (beta-lactamase superfamily II)
MQTEIAPGLVVVETGTADGKVGVIAGEQIALAVDAGIDDAEGAAVLAAARRLGRPAIRLAYTHGHVDHALGGTAFRGLDILASPEISAHMRAQIDLWAKRTGEGPADLERRIGWPTTMFDAGGELDLGGRRVRLIDTPGHAPGALCVHDPDAGILFGGDTIVTGIPPWFKDGDSATLLATLRTLARLDLDLLIPGHGAIVRGSAAIAAAITWEADYLERCRAHVERRLGEPIETIVSAAPFEAFIGAHLPPERHQMEWRHEQVLRLAYAEFTAKR